MEQTMVKGTKPLQMIKALFLAYAVTAVLLLLLAFLLYKLQLGESQVNLGIMIIYIVSCLAGGFYMGRKGKMRRFLWGMGLGAGYSADRETGSHGPERSGDDLLSLHFGRRPGRNAVLKGTQKEHRRKTKEMLAWWLQLCYNTARCQRIIYRRINVMEHIKTLNTKSLQNTVKKGGCGECQTSCQSACKTSCTVGNQSCEHK